MKPAIDSIPSTGGRSQRWALQPKEPVRARSVSVGSRPFCRSSTTSRSTTVALGKDPTLAPGAGSYGNLVPMSYQNSGSGINNLSALETPITTFLCPSDTQKGHIANQMLDSNSRCMPQRITGAAWEATGFNRSQVLRSLRRLDGTPAIRTVWIIAMEFFAAAARPRPAAPRS